MVKAYCCTHYHVHWPLRCGYDRLATFNYKNVRCACSTGLSYSEAQLLTFDCSRCNDVLQPGQAGFAGLRARGALVACDYVCLCDGLFLHKPCHNGEATKAYNSADAYQYVVRYVPAAEQHAAMRFSYCAIVRILSAAGALFRINWL